MIKRLTFTILTITVLLACNYPRPNDPVFIAPSGGGISFPEEITSLSIPQDIVSIPDSSEPESTQTPAPTLGFPTPTPNSIVSQSNEILYYSQSGETLENVAIRFDVMLEDIESAKPLTGDTYLDPGQLLIIPNKSLNTTSSIRLIPDSEFVASLSSIDLNVIAYVSKANGRLSENKTYLKSYGNITGAEVIHQIALDNSVNPRLLLGLLDYQSNWVRGHPSNLIQAEYPYGLIDPERTSLSHQLRWAIGLLSEGYFMWRNGDLIEVTLKDGVIARLSPELNAGTAAVMYYFANIYKTEGWLNAIDPEIGFGVFYAEMFGDPWERAKLVEPLFPPDFKQPSMILPFSPNSLWSYTGGPHGAWESKGAMAAIDFAPASDFSGCVKSYKWLAAVAPGLIVRSDKGVVVIDMDGDGLEQTGWAIMYLHVATSGRIPVGSWVEQGDKIGYPSCEGGAATGTHVHLARKFNGEWITTDGPVPMVLGGWEVISGDKPYSGTLIRDGEIIRSSTFGSHISQLTRPVNLP